MNNPVNELMGIVAEPVKAKKPSNAALWMALAFANIIFLVLDTISGVTVYLFTEWWLYGALTVLAGFVPLLIHEAAFVRPYASYWQRFIAVVGAALAILSVITIGVCAAVINIMHVGVGVQTAEIATIVVLVLIAALHAILFAIYFYIDDGIMANQSTERMIANATHKSRVIASAGRVLKTADGALAFKRTLERQYGPQGAEVLDYLIETLLQDKNGDGIPDILQGKLPTQPRPMVNYASKTQMPTVRPERSDEDEHPNG